MAEGEPIYVVEIAGIEVSMETLAPEDPAWAAAEQEVIYRERDAIELQRSRREAGESLDGRYGFFVLQTAKAFALLHLKSVEQRVEDNLDRIQTFQG